MDVTGKVPVFNSMAPDPEPSLMPAPPADFGHVARPVHGTEVYGDIQDVTSLVVPAAPSEPRHAPTLEEMDLLGTGTDQVAYGQVPPVTPDFFARSAGKGRR